MPETKDPRRKRIEDAYRDLLASLERTILWNGVRQDARDLVHEIFRSFVEGRVDLADIKNLPGYLKRSARNAALRSQKERLRALARELRIDQPAGDDVDGGEIQIATEDRLDGESVLDEAMSPERLQRAIGRLDPLERAFVEMELKGMSSREIAIELGIKRDRAERVMTRTHRRLKSLLSDDVI